MTTTQSNSDRLPSVMELMVEIKKYWTTATGEPELKEFAEYVQEIIQSRDRQLEQRVLEAVGDNLAIPTGPRAAGKTYAIVSNRVKAELRTKLKGVFNTKGDV